jgi:hypothetical protein
MDRVTIEDVDDRGDAQHDELEVDLATLPTEDGVRYLMGHGTAEMDARFLVAMAKGEIGSDARAVRSRSDARTS